MIALLKKEIGSFLYSFIGYIVISVFLLFTGLLMWVFPMDSNVLDNGFANIDSLFIMAPWIFLFLIPAITMRSFADEKKSGTIEQLLTKPLSDLQIILAKFFAGLTLVMFSLIPTLIYYYTVHTLGNPAGNIDTGSMWGSYIGLILLASTYVSIGIFASSLTDNQLVSFILAAGISVFLCYGFDTISSFSLFKNMDDVIISLGINEHYKSISRGVVDTRDVVYFLSIVCLFTLGTKTVLESRKW